MFLTRCTEITSASFRFYFAKITTPPLTSNFFCEKMIMKKKKRQFFPPFQQKGKDVKKLGSEHARCHTQGKPIGAEAEVEC